MGRKNLPKQQVTISDFFCTECGRRVIPLPRRIGAQREPGHLKKLFCYNCKKETNCAEIRPFGAYNYEDFLEEFQLGRFKDGQKTPIADLVSCSKTDCEYNIHGKCWNDNKSFTECTHRPPEREERICQEN